MPELVIEKSTEDEILALEAHIKIIEKNSEELISRIKSRINSLRGNY